MKPKQTKREPSERTRNLRHGPVQERLATTTTTAANDHEVDGRTRVNEQVASLALRSAAASKGAAAGAGGGISKSASSTGRGKKLTSKQRKRREQMMERGSAFTEKIERKASETEASQRNVKARALEWDRINERAMAELYAADEREARLSRVAE